MSLLYLLVHRAIVWNTRPIILGGGCLWDHAYRTASRPSSFRRTIINGPTRRALTSTAQITALCSRRCPHSEILKQIRTSPPRPAISLRAQSFGVPSVQTKTATCCFSTSCRVRAPPVFVLLAGMLKSSGTLAAVQTIGRFLLSLFPMVWAKTRIMRFLGKLVDVEKHPQLAAKQASYLLASKRLRVVTTTLLVLPISLIALTALASSERTPLTGRWRVILLSPAEEEAIAADLRGPKWYDAIRDVLTQSSSPQKPPAVLAQNDWRWAWVEQTLRQLERAVIILHDAQGYRVAYENMIAHGDEKSPLVPPPPKYPLLPRARVTSRMHEATLHSDLDHEKAPEHPEQHTHHVAPHTLLGPPYSLLIIEKEESNAFSYGFGPEGAGGVVVYSGFLDDILSDTRHDVPPPLPAASQQRNTGIFSSLMGQSSRAATPPPSSPSHVPPTPEQTTRLAILLAHELSHLILSHHIETLTQGTILFPSVISIAVDTIRSILYPITFVVGPFVGDALDRTLRMGFEDFAKSGEACTSNLLEIEADVISARILALAGFDPNDAISFWEQRLETMEQAKRKKVQSKSEDAHPVSQERVTALKKELASWKTERNKTFKRLQAEAEATVAAAV